MPRARFRTRALRLRGERAFERVFRTGVRHDASWLQLIAAPAEATPGRVGYIIGRRMIPLAVDRNRLRRRLREAVRAARPGILAFDIIVRLRRPLARTDISVAAAEGTRLLSRLAAPAP